MRTEHSIYGGWLIGFLNLTPAHTAPGVLVRSPTGEPIEALWTPGTHYLVRQVPELDGAWTRCLPSDMPVLMQALLMHQQGREPDPPRPEAMLVTDRAHFGDDEHEPAVPAWAPGLDGVGPHLTGADAEPVRWILLDGYVYDIRDDLYDQPGRWSVNEWRPQTLGELTSDPLSES